MAISNRRAVRPRRNAKSHSSKRETCDYLEQGWRDELVTVRPPVDMDFGVAINLHCLVVFVINDLREIDAG
jgi:hypothetical protein